MTEETKPQTPEETPEQTEEKPEFEKKLEEIRTATEELKKASKEAKEIAAMNAFSGRTEQSQQEKKVETDSDYRKMVERNLEEGVYN